MCAPGLYADIWAPKVDKWANVWFIAVIDEEFFRWYDLTRLLDGHRFLWELKFSLWNNNA